jgi:hypothetical protein
MMLGRFHEASPLSAAWIAVCFIWRRDGISMVGFLLRRRVCRSANSGGERLGAERSELAAASGDCDGAARSGASGGK